MRYNVGRNRVTAGDFHHLKDGLPPIADSSASVLILGSLPSDKSIAAKQYYANPQNHFWRILYAAWGAGEPDSAYEERLRFLRSVGVGLWDVLSSASRVGSSDASIRDEVPNDVQALLGQYPGIARVLVNGTKARDAYRRHFKNAPQPALYVPSSSPTRGKHVLPWEERVPLWRNALGLGDPSNKGINLTARR